MFVRRLLLTIAGVILPLCSHAASLGGGAAINPTASLHALQLGPGPSIAGCDASLGARCGGGGGGATSPSAVTAFAAGTITQTSVQLIWTNSATGTAPIGYQILYAVHNSGNYTSFASGLTSGPETVTGLACGTAWDFENTASNIAGSATATLSNISTPACAVTLNALTLSTTTYAAGQSTGTVLATISGKTSGSTIAIESSDTSNRFTVSGTNLLAGSAFAGTAPGGYASGLTETLAGATNSPNTTTFTATVSGGGCSNSLNFSQACNSQYIGLMF